MTFHCAPCIIYKVFEPRRQRQPVSGFLLRVNPAEVVDEKRVSFLMILLSEATGGFFHKEVKTYMANAQIIEQKAARVEEIKEKFQQAKSVIFFDYRTLTVAEVTELRKNMRAEGVEYVVIKNNMVLRASEAAGIEGDVESALKGTLAYAFGFQDEVAPARILKDFIKKNKKGEFKGGVIDGKLTSAKEIEQIADLPSREVLISRLLGSMKAPISHLAIVLDQIAKAKEAPAAEAPAQEA